jgi:hypothetical protein
MCSEGLPNTNRSWGGQRFVHFRAGFSPSIGRPALGSENTLLGLDRALSEELGVEEATNRLAAVRVHSGYNASGKSASDRRIDFTHAGEVRLVFVLEGSCELHLQENPEGDERVTTILEGGHFAVPAAIRHYALLPPKGRLLDFFVAKDNHL